MTSLFDTLDYLTSIPPYAVIPKKETYTKTNIIKQDNGTYRVSITKFVDGNSDALSDIVNTLEEAKKFIADNK